MTDVFSREKRSEVMSKIRSKNTGIEREFQAGHPEAVPHPDWLPYHPDFLLGNEVVFLDSTFWHCLISKDKYGRLTDYWKGKLFKNLVRDLAADSLYGFLGVLRRI